VHKESPNRWFFGKIHYYMGITFIIGISGAVVVLIFFLLNQMNKISKDSLLYDGANFVGGLLLLIYAISLSVLPFIAVNIVWTLFSLWDFSRGLRRKYHNTKK